MVFINGEKIDSFNFSGGEVSVKTYYTDTYVMVKANLRNSRDIMELLLICEVLKRQRCTIGLQIPYIPYARQDRVCNEGEAFSIKVFAKLINDIGAFKVSGWDVHSDVTNALINNFHNVPCQDILSKCSELEKLLSDNSVYICSPDSGSLKKIQKVQEKFNIDNDRVILATKIRDVSTGNIVNTEVYADNLKGRKVLIIDDICDGGRTFIELAKKIKIIGSGKIILYVTHGIFSKGFEVFENIIDEVWTTDSFCNIKHPKLNIIGEDDV